MTPEEVIRHAANPFLALGLPVALISPIELKRKYKKLALIFHPDKNSHPDAEAAFKIIASAYEQLSDVEKQQALVRRFSNPLPFPTNPTPPIRPTQTHPFSIFFFADEYLKKRVPKPKPQNTTWRMCPSCHFATFDMLAYEFHQSVHIRRPASTPNTGFKFGAHNRIFKEPTIPRVNPFD
jgi:hypothetical protein